MSADNWAICPKCKDEAKQAVIDARGALADAYGKVPAEEFEALREAIPQVLDTEALRTFREDYELYGADTGVVKVDYVGRCTECGLSVQLSSSRRFYP